MGEPYSVGMSPVSMMSLIATGMPCSGLRGGSASRARACSSACRGSMYAHACTAPSRASTRARQSSASLTAVSFRDPMSAAAPATEYRFDSPTGPPLLARNARVGNHFAPPAPLRHQQLRELLRRSARRLHADSREALPDFRRLQGGVDLLIELRHDPG